MKSRSQVIIYYPTSLEQKMVERVKRKLAAIKRIVTKPQVKS